MSCKLQNTNIIYLDKKNEKKLAKQIKTNKQAISKNSMF